MRLMLTWPMRMLIALLVAIGAMSGTGHWVACVEADGRVIVEARHEKETCPPCDAAHHDEGGEPCEDLVVPEAKASMGESAQRQIMDMQWIPAALVLVPETPGMAAGIRLAEHRGDPPRLMVVTTVILLV
jgi:hypothetical protein